MQLQTYQIPKLIGLDKNAAEGESIAPDRIENLRPFRQVGLSLLGSRASITQSDYSDTQLSLVSFDESGLTSFKRSSGSNYLVMNLDGDAGNRFEGFVGANPVHLPGFGLIGAELGEA